VTVFVGKIEADSATIARHLAAIRTRIRFPHRGAGRVDTPGASSATARGREGLRNRVQLPLNPGRSR